MRKIICLVLAVVVSLSSAFAFETDKYDNWDINQYIVQEGKSDEEAVEMYVGTLERMVANKGYGVVYKTVDVNFDDYETFAEAVEATFGEDISSLGLTFYESTNTCLLSYDDLHALKYGDALAMIGVTLNGLMYMIIVLPL
jgi:hypothetical protein